MKWVHCKLAHPARRERGYGLRIRHEMKIEGYLLTVTSSSPISLGLNEALGTESLMLLVPNYNADDEENTPSLLIRTKIEVNVEGSDAEFLRTLKTQVEDAYIRQDGVIPLPDFLARVHILGPGRASPIQPKGLASLDILQIYETLKSAGSIAFNKVRWRTGTIGTSDISQQDAMVIEVDPGDWRLLYSHREHLEIHWSDDEIDLTHTTLKDFVYQGDNQEPLSWNLVRDAYGYMTTSPRLSLLLAITAAELSTKQFLAGVLPDFSRPIIEEVQMIYLGKLMKNVLPGAFQSTRTVTNPTLPYETIIKPLVEMAENGVQVRNIIVHRPMESDASKKLSKRLNQEYLSLVLTATKDLLHFLDYFSGKDWALDYLSEGSKRDWFERNPRH